MASFRLYQYTSIGRSLDPAWPSNRAVLVLMPLAAALGAVLAWLDGRPPAELLSRGLALALMLFLAWALARELDPDDPSAAFISLALGLLVGVANPGAGLLTAVTTLGLIRIVNRSTGLAPKVSDSVILLLLSVWVIYSIGSPWFGGVAALAFVLDGSLKHPLRRQWVYALLCLGAMVVYMVDHEVVPGAVGAPASLFEWLSVLALLMFAIYLLLTRTVRARGDVGGQPLDLTRVRGGMAVGLLAGLQGLGRPDSVAILLAAIGGICIAMAVRKGFRSPAAMKK